MVLISLLMWKGAKCEPLMPADSKAAATDTELAVGAIDSSMPGRGRWGSASDNPGDSRDASRLNAWLGCRLQRWGCAAA